MMKKFLLSLFLLLPLTAGAYWNSTKMWSIKFTDGRVVKPIYTRSLGANTDECPIKKGYVPLYSYEIIFYFNNDELYEKNMQSIKDARVEDHLSNVCSPSFLLNGRIALNGVKEYKELKN